MLYFLPLKFATTLYFTGFPGISHPLTDVPTHKYLFVIYSVKLHIEIRTLFPISGIKEVSTNNCCKFMAIFIVFPGFCLKQLQQLFSDNS